jgi:serine/threonine protein kinase
MPCLDELELLDVAEGRRALSTEALAHVADCRACRLVLAAAARGATTATATATAVDNADLDEPTWDELGQGVVVAGRYELDRFLGSGGMGVVWSARRQSDGMRVAIKVARSGDPELARRLEREARILSEVAHPNVCITHELLPATPSRGPCIVQELLDGETLEQRLSREGRLSLGACARVLVPVANALAAAHARGVVHRDVKPANIFLADARVMVLDFGIAKSLSVNDTAKLTRTGQLLGTPAFMAPEQLVAERDVDARADVWALGVVLFRALTGRLPLEGARVWDLVSRLEHLGPDFLAAALQGVPADVAGLVGDALVVRREGRIADVTAFVRVLGPHLAPGLAHPKLR